MKRFFLLSFFPLLFGLYSCNTAADKQLPSSQSNEQATSGPAVHTIYNTSFTGRGNKCEELLSLHTDADDGCLVTGVSVRLDAAGAQAVDKLYLLTGEGDSREILSRMKRARGGEIKFKLKRAFKMEDGGNGLKLCADIAEDASEGSIIKASVSSVKTDQGVITPLEQGDASLKQSDAAQEKSDASRKQGNAGREVLLTRVRLYAPGDYGSRNYRIPAIACLPDGTLLAVNDKRKFNEGDLPEDIDIVSRRSTDGGRTWSEPVEIAVGQGRGKGFGDPALAITDDGEVVCVFVGGNGLWASTPEKPQRSYVARSRDGGKTWSAPEDITHVVYGPQSDNPQCRDYTSSFFGSGNGLTVKRGEHAGRIMFVAAMCRGGLLFNHAVYSDDRGKTWQVSDVAFEGGDEAKVVELSDGKILMSIRQSGERGYSISADGGQTWEDSGRWPEMTTNACNGDMIRYSEGDGANGCGILLHSVPNSLERRNVSIFRSYDDGRTWVSPKTICSGKSVHSSMTVLPDGTIGIYVEENPTEEGCSLWFMNFSLDWLLRP